MSDALFPEVVKTNVSDKYLIHWKPAAMKWENQDSMMVNANCQRLSKGQWWGKSITKYLASLKV